MKFTRSAVLLLALTVPMAACDDDDPTNPDPEPDPVAALAGEYDVQSFRYDADDSDQSIDLALIPPAQGGPYGILEMAVEEDGSFSGSMRLPGTDPFPVGGDIEVTGAGAVRIDFDANTDALGFLDDFEDGTYQLTNNVLTLVLPDVTFDFTMSGEDEVDADLTIVASR